MNTVRSFLVSSTAAKRVDTNGATAIPNAAPDAESIENSETKLPLFVNSTISLFWLGVCETFTMSPLVVIKCPFGVNASANGPRRCALSW